MLKLFIYSIFICTILMSCEKDPSILNSESQQNTPATLPPPEINLAYLSQKVWILTDILYNTNNTQISILEECMKDDLVEYSMISDTYGRYKVTFNTPCSGNSDSTFTGIWAITGGRWPIQGDNSNNAIYHYPITIDPMITPSLILELSATTFKYSSGSNISGYTYIYTALQ